MTADEFIQKWRVSGGNERANTQLFVNDLCALLGVESPQPTVSDTQANDYVFERHVIKTEIDGTTSNGWVDCYKRDSFILEAKQGSAADIAAVEGGAGDTLRDLFGQTAAERYKRGMATVLSDKDRDVAERGCVSLIRQYHDTIDDLVADAYGWPRDLSDEQILENLVALNKERAAEEAKGKVRWLRPEFQAPGYKAPAEQASFALPEEAKTAEIIPWPTTLPDQVVAVAQVVERAGRPIAANDVARAFKGKKATTLTPVLDALAGMGRLRKLEDGRYAA